MNFCRVLLCSAAGHIAIAPFTATAAPDGNTGMAQLVWSERAGVSVKTDWGIIGLDRSGEKRGPVFRFLPSGEARTGTQTQVQRLSKTQLRIVYDVLAPDNGRIKVERLVNLVNTAGETELTEEFALTPDKSLASDLEIERPFTLAPKVRPASAESLTAVLPQKDGWARPSVLSNGLLRAEYRLGNVLTGKETQELALPVVQCGEDGLWLAAVSADPRFSALFELAREHGELRGTVRYQYAASRIPMAAGAREVRRFGVWLAGAAKEKPFGQSIDAFFRQMLPEVPPGPAWLHDIAMVHYDYLSDGGKGWELDVNELAKLLPLKERRRVALCFHGWYDGIGSYCYDSANKRMKSDWLAMARSRKVAMTQEYMRHQLQLARALGFRVLLYFADGMLQDSGAPFGYVPEWDLVDFQGKRVNVNGWTGPDTWGTTYARNPANPAVFQWYQDYLAALIETYGADVDGFVWDESNYIGTGAMTSQPQPAYCDRAMLNLVQTLTRQVKAVDSQKAFLSSENIYMSGTNVPGYGMVADGVFQDSQCAPEAWSYGLFPTWRNTLWSCNWRPITHFDKTRWGVEHFGVPVAISSGWAEYRGPHAWSAQERDQILGLFRQRLQPTQRVRYLPVNPRDYGQPNP